MSSLVLLPFRPGCMRRRLCRLVCGLVFVVWRVMPAGADSVAPRAEDNSVAAELASFEVAEGYEVSLFASEANGVANPIAIRWDGRGRLWVICSLVYPQLYPTEKANDKLYILEDTDRDGVADRTKVFAEGLDMPTGFILGEGGVFVGEGPDLVFLRDRDGDDRADEREEVFSGFGTDDTHQNINSFAWSPGGELFFCQGLHGSARVETPWGIVRMDEHGVWRMRPRRLQLHAFRGGSSQNPWGITHGPWGEPFVKGGSDVTLSELLPIMVHTDHYHPPVDIGRTQIKSMIVELVDSPHLPEDLQGNLLIAGYFAHIIDRMKLMPDGAGHRTENLPPLLRSSHRSFRPVDIQTGPDGALYVADWFNPIIGHYQASLRHPDRDKEHGRIWRITARGRPVGAVEDLTRLGTAELLRRLPGAPLRERERIRIELSHRPAGEVVDLLEMELDPARFAGLDPDRVRFEKLCLYEWNETIRGPLLETMLQSSSPWVRAYAVRVTGRWQDRLPDALGLLDRAVRDLHPRVRLEAVVALSYLSSAEAMRVAAQALDAPVDRFIETAMIQATHALKPNWWPAFLEGTLAFARPHHVAFVLQQTAGGETAATVRTMLGESTFPPETTRVLRTLLALHGTPEDLRWVLEEAGGDARVLSGLAESAELRGVRPVGGLAEVVLRLLGDADPAVRVEAVRLAGLWQLTGLTERVRQIALEASADTDVRVAGVMALGQLQGQAAMEILARLLTTEGNPAVQEAALRALCGLDEERAARLADPMIRGAKTEEALREWITPFAARATGLESLAKALGHAPLEAELAGRIRGVLGTAGRYSVELDRLLTPTGATGLAIGLPDYSESYVGELAAEVKREGRVAEGANVYAEAGLGCGGCHKLGETGGSFGPELTAVGAGLPVELIIEAVLWPDRQIKEGYLATALTLQDGEFISGYVQSESPQAVVIRDIATGEVRTMAANRITGRTNAGTIMPAGLTAALTREQLRDLIGFLSQQTGRGQPEGLGAGPTQTLAK